MNKRIAIQKSDKKPDFKPLARALLETNAIARFYADPANEAAFQAWLKETENQEKPVE